MVAFYPFCGNANDASGNGNNGTVNGSVLTSDRFGSNDNAYSFNNNTISIPHQSYFGFSNTSKFSVSLWAYKTVNNNFVHFIGLRQPGGQSQFWQIYTYAGDLLFQTNENTHMFGANATGQAGDINVWVNIIGTFENGNWRLYINGSLRGSYSSNDNFNNDVNTELTIGNSGNFQPFYGKIDDVMIYDRALTPCEISQLYNATPSQP